MLATYIRKRMTSKNSETYHMHTYAHTVIVCKIPITYREEAHEDTKAHNNNTGNKKDLFSSGIGVEVFTVDIICNQ